MSVRLRVGIVGGSGYTGGELLRLLHHHPHIQVVAITSREHAGHYIHSVHPHLRGLYDLQFIHPSALEPCDVLFLALPHGALAQNLDTYLALAPRLIDLSADFRLRTDDAYRRWYGAPHPRPDWLGRFVYGLPEVNREALRDARYVSGVGCNATAINLALLPLARAGLLQSVSADIKVGSSEGGNQPNSGSHHPIRSGAVRTYSPTGHRHHAEVEMILGSAFPIRFSVTAIEMVRGVHVVAHGMLKQPQTEKDLWRLYRQTYADEPFIRLVNAKSGVHRYPEPRIVSGSNYCDIGFAVSEDGCHVVIISALDNLVKGAAGTAIQCLNVMMGYEETIGLTSAGVYP